jgi:hypothetical protein
MLAARISTPKIAALAACATLLLAAAGCHSKTAATPENFTEGLNTFFADHPECLLPNAPRFPYETGDPTEIKQMNALVASQLLTVSSEQSIRVSRYTPTPTGARLAPKFCYGHRVVTSIDSFTPPAPANGFPESQVVYHYKIEDLPVWANSEGIRSVFPDMALKTSGSASDKAVMASTIAGWKVPD